MTPTPLVVFRKLYLLNRGWKPVFFVTFNIIIGHIFPENFTEITQLVQKIWRISLSILAIFINFYLFSGFFDISFVKKNLMVKKNLSSSWNMNVGVGSGEWGVGVWEWGGVSNWNKKQNHKPFCNLMLLISHKLLKNMYIVLIFYLKLNT